MTPWQLRQIATAHGEEIDFLNNGRVAQAWHTANFTVAAQNNKLKNLKDYLSDGKLPSRDDVASQVAATMSAFPKTPESK